MVDDTHPNILRTRPDLKPGGLVIQMDPTPVSWQQVEPGGDVLFGRTSAEEQGLANPLAGGVYDLTLSRRHARLVVDDAGAYLVDLGSTNGTWLNGMRLAPRAPAALWSGDGFKVGVSRYAWLAAVARERSGEGARGWFERDAFERACLALLVRAFRYGRPLALLVVSDTGAAADIEMLGDPIWSVCLHTDAILGRVAPDEWAAVFPEAAGREARAVARTLRTFTHTRPARRRLGLGWDVRVGLTTLEPAAEVSRATGDWREDVTLNMDHVRLLLAAAREDRDTRGRKVRVAIQ